MARKVWVPIIAGLLLFAAAPAAGAAPPPPSNCTIVPESSRTGTSER